MEGQGGLVRKECKSPISPHYYPTCYISVIQVLVTLPVVLLHQQVRPKPTTSLSAVAVPQIMDEVLHPHAVKQEPQDAQYFVLIAQKDKDKPTSLQAAKCGAVPVMANSAPQGPPPKKLGAQRVLFFYIITRV